MDAGPVALVRRLEMGAQETTGELEDRLAVLAADAIAEALERHCAGTLQWREQDAEQATLAPKIEREDARIDWRADSQTILRQVRAMAPRPGATTQLDDEPLRVLAAQAGDLPKRARCASPGTVEVGQDRRLWVATGDVPVELLRVQRAGARVLETEAFLRGRPIEPGTVLA